MYQGNAHQKTLHQYSSVSILVTSARPDMVLIKNMLITLVELTIPYDSERTSKKCQSKEVTKKLIPRTAW